jgi:peptidoglycan/LPS O-acetylase OafA/YrhL
VGFLLILSFVFQVPWAHLWYWYVFFGANFALAFGKVSVAAMTPLWSLAVEEQFYFIWPWIVLLCRKQTLRRIAVAVVIVSPILRAVFTPLFATHFPIYSLTIFRADTLAAGAFIALSEAGDIHWIERYRRVAMAGAAAALVLFGIFSALPRFRTGANSILFNSFGYTFSVILFGSTLTYTLGLRQGWLHGILTARPVRYLGRISYTFYLYHLAVLLKVEEHVHSTILMAAFAFVITVAIAAVSWRFFESPILKARQTEPRRREALSA